MRFNPRAAAVLGSGYTYVTARIRRVSIFLSFTALQDLKSSNLPLIYLPHLHNGVRALWDFVLFGRLVRPANALYAISVRQTESLP